MSDKAGGLCAAEKVRAQRLLRWIISQMIEIAQRSSERFCGEPRGGCRQIVIRPRLHAQSEPRKDGQPPWRRPVGTISEAAPLGRAYVPVHRGARGH